MWRSRKEIQLRNEIGSQMLLDGALAQGFSSYSLIGRVDECRHWTAIKVPTTNLSLERLSFPSTGVRVG
ncbi:hypothetical protein SAMN04490220_0737 [Rhodococcus jostii]|uniref:Uncharacterized protein n=1 Tax=Rhodococcus jostii TaxID=132919 RepID=A0A1H4JBR2_RHOJO|nr:hypothetical protein SAMN04490220_0737 [Rhodococcus jostii]